MLSCNIAGDNNKKERASLIAGPWSIRAVSVKDRSLADVDLDEIKE